ncbi:DUF4412 domain-containing protein [Falsiroseomonas oryziterrae]|uniref:DUF4412 domain-containing protein n=1 Tax=Falsiroseomonas oryziterrae TaxID=2911368 RepID=UPI001F33FE6C|nr:DUF4412 domain-containing protein [Roseomonas sp. NPKOSM-4]
MRRTALATLLVVVALPAAAQERPPLTPTRDVAVTYRVIGAGAQQIPPGAPNSMTISWLAAQGLMRSDMPGGMGWMVADPRNGRAFMVMEPMRAIMDIPAAQAMAQQMNSPTATFRREGTATIAGQQCTVWVVQDGGSQGRSCVTADGVVLRAEGTHQGQTGGMEATAVQFGPQDPARFQRPAGYQTMQMPQGMPPGMGGPAPGRPPGQGPR